MPLLCFFFAGGFPKPAAVSVSFFEVLLFFAASTACLFVDGTVFSAVFRCADRNVDAGLDARSDAVPLPVCRSAGCTALAAVGCDGCDCGAAPTLFAVRCAAEGARVCVCCGEKPGEVLPLPYTAEDVPVGAAAADGASVLRRGEEATCCVGALFVNTVVEPAA